MNETEIKLDITGDDEKLNGEALSIKLDIGYFAIQKMYEREYRGKYIGCENPFSRTKGLTDEQIVAACTFYKSPWLIQELNLSNVQLEMSKTGNVQMSKSGQSEIRQLDNLDNSGNVQMSNLDKLDKTENVQMSKIRQLDNRQLDNKKNVQMSNLSKNGHLDNGQLDIPPNAANVQMDAKALIDAQKQIERLTKQKNTVETQLIDLQAQLKVLTEDNEKTTIAHLETVKKLDNKYNQLKSEMSNLSKSAKEELDKQRTQLMSNFEKEKSKLNDELDKLREKLSDSYTTTKGDFSQEIKDLRLDVANARKEAKADFEQERNGFLDRIEKLNTQIDTIRDSVKSDYSTQIERLEAQIEDLNEQLKAKRAEVKAEYETTIQEHKGEILQLKSKIEQQEKKLKAEFYIERTELLRQVEQASDNSWKKRFEEAQRRIKVMTNVKPFFFEKENVIFSFLIGMMLVSAFLFSLFITKIFELSGHAAQVPFLPFVSLGISLLIESFGLILTLNTPKNEYGEYNLQYLGFFELGVGVTELYIMWKPLFYNTNTEIHIDWADFVIVFLVCVFLPFIKFTFGKIFLNKKQDREKQSEFDEIPLAE